VTDDNLKQSVQLLYDLLGANKLGRDGDDVWLCGVKLTGSESLDVVEILNRLKAELGDLTGERGEDGEAAAIEIGNTQTLAPGSQATVNNSGNETNAVLNFGIPQGIQGIQGIQGNQGNQGIQGNPGSQGPAGPAGTWVSAAPGSGTGFSNSSFLFVANSTQKLLNCSMLVTSTTTDFSLTIYGYNVLVASYALAVNQNVQCATRILSISNSGSNIVISGYGGGSLGNSGDLYAASFTLNLA
jgi:hypothetical protein